MVCEGCKHRFEEDKDVLEYIPLPLPPPEPSRRPEGDPLGSESAVQSATEAAPGRKKRTRRGGQKRRRREDGSGMSDAADNEDERMLSEGERDQAGRTPRGGGSNREPYAHLAQQTPLLSYQRPQAVWPDEMSTDDLQMPQPSSPSAERAAPVERARVLPQGTRYSTTTDSMLGFQQLEQPEASPYFTSVGGDAPTNFVNADLLDTFRADLEGSLSWGGYTSSPILRRAIERRRTTDMEATAMGRGRGARQDPSPYAHFSPLQYGAATFLGLIVYHMHRAM